jgi:hypothetical protein
MVINNVCVFLQRSIYPRMAAASSSVVATPYKLFLKVPRVNKKLASSDFTFKKRLKAAGTKYGK